MINGPFYVLESCVNQGTGKRYNPGETINNLSAGEYGRLTAFGKIAPGKIKKKEEHDMTTGKGADKESKKNSKHSAKRPAERAIKRPAETRAGSRRGPFEKKPGARGS